MVLICDFANFVRYSLVIYMYSLYSLSLYHTLFIYLYMNKSLSLSLSFLQWSLSHTHTHMYYEEFFFHYVTSMEVCICISRTPLSLSFVCLFVCLFVFSFSLRFESPSLPLLLSALLCLHNSVAEWRRSYIYIYMSLSLPLPKRSYQPASTVSHQICAVKRAWAELVLGLVTTWESSVTLLHFFLIHASRS